MRRFSSTYSVFVHSNKVYEMLDSYTVYITRCGVRQPLGAHARWLRDCINNCIIMCSTTGIKIKDGDFTKNHFRVQEIGAVADKLTRPSQSMILATRMRIQWNLLRDAFAQGAEKVE